MRIYRRQYLRNPLSHFNLIMKKYDRRPTLTEQNIDEARATSMKKINGPNGLEVLLGKSGTNYFRYRRLDENGKVKTLGNSKECSLAEALKRAEEYRKADEVIKPNEHEKRQVRRKTAPDDTSLEAEFKAVMSNFEGAIALANEVATEPVLRTAIRMVMVLPSLAEELLALEWGSVLNDPRAVLINNDSRGARKSLTTKVRAVYLPDSLYRAVNSQRSSKSDSRYVLDNKTGGHWSTSKVFAEVRHRTPKANYLSTKPLRSLFKRWILSLEILNPKFAARLMRGYLYAGETPENVPEISAAILDLWSQKLGLKDLDGQYSIPSDRFATPNPHDDDQSTNVRVKVVSLSAGDKELADIPYSHDTL